MPGSPAHLFRRFLDVATARGLTASEKEAISTWLVPDLADVFFSQNDADQRHGYHAALSVIASGIEDQAVITAALVHDVGKRHARLGIIGRSAASVLILLGLPLPDRLRIYRDHGVVAARELAGLGAPPLAIDFAIHHHGKRPPSIDPATWAVLVAADQPPKTQPWSRPRITSGRR